MSAAYSRNLLDEAMEMKAGRPDARSFDSYPRRRFVLVEDCVETSGGFVLHHFMKKAIFSSEGIDVVIFLALAQNFSHYDSIMKKLGCNLSLQRDKKKLFFFELIERQFPDDQGCRDLYSEIYKTVESVISPQTLKPTITILIDDISLLESSTGGSTDHVLDFLHYCITFSSKLDFSLVLLTHSDIYTETEGPTLLSHLEYLADTIIRVEPLRTGLSADVHGQLKIMDKTWTSQEESLRRKMQSFQFRVKDNTVDYFYPGSLA